jgi:hypothetical protein
VDKRVLFYTNPDTWNTWLVPFVSPEELNRLARRDLWVAQWPFVIDDTGARGARQPNRAQTMGPWTIWQFSADNGPKRGDEFGVGSDKIDLDVFNGTLEEMQQHFGAQVGPLDVHPGGTHDDTVAGGGGLPGGEARPDVTNQQMINAFFRVGAALGAADPFELVVRAGLTSMADPNSNRTLPYSGPPVGAIPGLSDAERAALRATLAGEPIIPVEPIDEGEPPPDVTFINWEHRAVMGLHGPADPGGGWVPEAFEVVQQARVRAIKVLVPDFQPGEGDRLRQIIPDMFLMARLFSNQLGERRGQDGTPAGTGRWLANEVADPGDGNNPMNRAFNAGIRFFEVHNEPNLISEGLRVNWQDGAEFVRFFQAVVDVLRPRYPGAQFGFPGLSPGPVGDNRAIEAGTFLRQARAATEAADFLCCHVYWGQMGVTLQDALNDLRAFCRQFPNKRIVCSEFSNNDPNLDREAKADQYFEFFQACRSMPSNLGAMFAYALSWRDDVNREGFLQLGNDGRWGMTPMAGRLGGHNF